MGFFEASNILGNGLSVQRQIMDIIAENMANVNTLQTPEGGPYQRKIPVVGAREAVGFPDILKSKMYDQVYLSNIVRDTAPPRMEYEPNHPLADENGYVYRPDINVSMEMIRMMSASRAYEANIAAFNASKMMANKALQIGN